MTLPRKASQRYIFRTKDGRVYEYTLSLHNDTKKNKNVEAVRKKIIQQMYERALLLRRNLIGQNFERLPSKGAMRVHLHGEIVSARGFDCGAYFIRYFVQLPESYQIEDDDRRKLSAASQTAVPMTTWTADNSDSGSGEVAHFGFPFHLDMLTTRLHPSPTIYFQVVSRDFWNRYRTEGYGYMSAPKNPTIKLFQVNTWKPRGTMRNDLRSYFVGGAQELSDVTYAGVPRDFQDTFLNKHSLVTTASGTINVKVHMTIQV